MYLSSSHHAAAALSRASSHFAGGRTVFLPAPQHARTPSFMAGMGSLASDLECGVVETEMFVKGAVLGAVIAGIAGVYFGMKMG